MSESTERRARATAQLVGPSRAQTVPLRLVDARGLAAWRKRQGKRVGQWLRATGFKAAPGTVALLPDNRGGLAGALVGCDNGAAPQLWDFAGLSRRLPPGRYALDPAPDAATADRAALGWALGSYAFERYKRAEDKLATLVWPAAADRDAVTAAAGAVYHVRDLVNTPANDMAPEDLAKAAQDLAEAYKAKAQVVVGDALLKAGYPTIHVVGRAAGRSGRTAPRLIDLRWGDARAPKVTLVGKGVCFDSGGLDIKPAAGMRLMKKDMGGAANVLGLAEMIMAAELPVRLRVLVPAVENAIAGDAMHPMDVIRTRAGITVEIGNTDAEGRLVLCDALAEAVTEQPALLVDMATLTGAARVALGPDLPALFCNDEALAAGILNHGEAEADPLWRLPLWQPYKEMLKSKVADLNNVSEGGYAGSVTAALFLQAFVDKNVPWAHLDVFAWNASERPGRPIGGEAMGIRALFALVRGRFGKD
jgi:leucyl aminopeptidase